MHNLQSTVEGFDAPPTRLRMAVRWATTQMAAGLQAARGHRCADGFGILMYHRVADHVAGVAAPTWNVSPDRLRRQLSGLLTRGFECWPLAKMVEAHLDSRAVPSNVFAVTFDDGYENNYRNAWPVLRELNVPATIFLATKYLDSDGPFPFDDWSAKACKGVPAIAWRPLTTAQCEEMRASGLIELGAHTHSHQRFLGQHDEFRNDLRMCLDLLRGRFGIDRPLFAFPFGDHDAKLVDVARQLGVTCGVSTLEKRVRPGEDPFHWGRYHVGPTISATALAAKLSGWHTTVATAGKRFAYPLGTIRRPSRRSSSPC